MNYIDRLQTDNRLLREQLRQAREVATDLLLYYASDKFHGNDTGGNSKDYAHVSTDVLPRINEVIKKL